MQKALFPDHPLSGFSLQPRQNKVLTGVGRKRAVYAMGLLEQAQAVTSVSCSRQSLGREIEVPALRHRHPPEQAQEVVSVSRSRQGLGREIETNSRRHRRLPAQAQSGFSSLPPKQGFGGREEKRAALKKTPEDVWMTAKKREEEKRKQSQQESPALRIRETAKRFCESSEPPPVGPLSWAQACVDHWALSPPSGAQCQPGWRRSRLDLSL